jgi:hypothetical protein
MDFKIPKVDFKGYEGKFVAIDRDSGEIVMSQDDGDRNAVRKLAKVISNTEKLLGCYVQTKAEKEAARARREESMPELRAKDDEESKWLAAVCTRINLEEDFDAPAYRSSTDTAG